jgi:hypothetical protein
MATLIMMLMMITENYERRRGVSCSKRDWLAIISRKRIGNGAKES